MNKGENNKINIRLKIKEQRELLSMAEVQKKSKLVKGNLISSTIFQRAKTILFYVDFRNEVQTLPLMAEALLLGKNVVAPLISKGKKEIYLYKINDLKKDLKPGSYGILEPDPKRTEPLNPLELDIVLVPGIVFDLYGNRLGFGGGYYDRFLLLCSEKCRFVALAYDFQVESDLSKIVESHDIKVDYLVTEQKILCTRKEFLDTVE